METIKKKMDNLSIYFILSIGSAIMLPILFKNFWICIFGLTFSVFFAYQIFLLDKLAKSGKFLEIKAKCVDKKRAGFGATTYSSVYEFAPLSDNEEEKTFFLQIANGEKNRKNDKLVINGIYNFVFEEKQDEYNQIILNNNTLIAFARVVLRASGNFVFEEKQDK